MNSKNIILIGLIFILVLFNSIFLFYIWNNSIVFWPFLWTYITKSKKLAVEENQILTNKIDLWKHFYFFDKKYIPLLKEIYLKNEACWHQIINPKNNEEINPICWNASLLKMIWDESMKIYYSYDFEKNTIRKESPRIFNTWNLWIGTENYKKVFFLWLSWYYLQKSKSFYEMVFQYLKH